MLLSSLKLYPILDWDVQFALCKSIHVSVYKKEEDTSEEQLQWQAHKNQNNLEF